MKMPVTKHLVLSLAACILACLPASYSYAGKVGGSGGQYTKYLTCGSDEFITAIYASGGLFVENIRISCAKYDPKNKIFVPGSSNSWFRSPQPNPGEIKGGTCPGSTWNGKTTLTLAKVINTRAGLYVDHLQSVNCSKYIPGKLEPGSLFSIGAGGPGGIGKRLYCDGNTKALYKLKVRYGNWIDSITSYCRTVPSS